MSLADLYLDLWPVDVGHMQGAKVEWRRSHAARNGEEQCCHGQDT